MSDRGSPVQANYPIPEDFVVLARRRQQDAIYIMLNYVWQAYDQMRTGDAFEVTKDDAHLEDEITAALHARVQDVIRKTAPFSPFAPVHQPLESGRQKHKGRPPQSDLGFRILGGNIRSHFSIEAKLIRTAGSVNEYVKEIKVNFLTGRYSTFSSEAAMLGYLLSGTASQTFQAIAKALQCILTECAYFSDRDHRCSCHSRDPGCDSIMAGEFRCHHLLMRFK